MKYRIRRGVALGVALVLAGLTITSTTEAAPSAAAPVDRATTELLVAMQRDLGLTPEQAADRIGAQDAALRLKGTLVPRLGKDFAGAWLDEKSGRLVVALTAGERAAQARTAGAGVAMVTHSLAELDTIKNELDALVRSDPKALAGVTAWHTDPKRNAVVVTVLRGQSKAGALLAGYGDAVRVEETEVAPRPTADPLRGGDGISRDCSVGFNVFSGSTLYFLTAGHCGNITDDVYRNGVWIGPFARSNFPGTYAIEADRPIRGGFGDIAAPTLVVHGDHDPFLPLPHGEALRDAIPGAELLVLAGAGHDLPRPVWDAFVPALIRHTGRDALTAPRRLGAATRGRPVTPIRSQARS